MRIHSMRIKDFKGLDVEIPWASAVVLFGANDSGKTNILEAVVSTFGDDELVRRRPWLPEHGDDTQDFSHDEDISVSVELDGLEIAGHRDQQLFLYWFCHTDQAEHDSEWAELSARYERLSRGADWAAEVAELVDLVREVARRDGARSGESAAGLAEEDVRSRWFLITGQGAQVDWMVPPDRGSEVILRRVHVGSVCDSLSIEAVFNHIGEGGFGTLVDRLEDLVVRMSREAGMLKVDGHPGLTLEPAVNDPWIERKGVSASLRPAIAAACAEIAARANALAPAFVSRAYEIVIAPLFPDEWDAYDGRHLAVRLRSRSGGVEFDLATTSEGIAVWTRYTLLEALRTMDAGRALSSVASSNAAPNRATVLYVFDEPEAHLHPLAQEEAAAWLAERTRTGAFVLLATHSLPFLDLPLEDVEYLKVVRSDRWASTVEPMTGDILGAIADSAEALGLPPVALIQATRGWLVVEGEHDRKIINAFYGRELRRAGVRILPLRGANRAKASFMQLEALAPLGLPFFCLLDKVRVEAVKSGRITGGNMSEEERIAEQVWRLLSREGVAGDLLGLPFLDVICVLPLKTLQHIASRDGRTSELDTSWGELIERYNLLRTQTLQAGRTPPRFKSFVRDALGLRNWSDDDLIGEALSLLEGHPPEANALGPIISEVLARVTGRPEELGPGGPASA